MKGNVCVTLNDSVFESSNGWKHASQLAIQIIRNACRPCGMEIVTRVRTFYHLKQDKKDIM